MNKKLFLGFILFLSVVFAFESVNAVGDLNITSIGTASGYPGESKTITLSINNTKTTTMDPVTFTSTDLVGPSSSVITAPAISDLTSVPGDGATTPQTFTINLPYLDYGVYRGNITATGTVTDYDTMEYQVTINAVANMTASASSLTMRGETDESVSKTFTIYNKGSYNLTNLAISNNVDLSDNDGDNITLSFSGLPSNLQPGESATITVKADIGNNVDIGTYSGNIYVNDTVRNTGVVIATTIQVKPEICEDGIIGYLDVTLEEPDDNDEFAPGETISVEVKVRNNNDDEMDVVVEAILYNIDEGDEVETVESDNQEIKEDKSETFDLDLEIPLDIDEDDTYILYVKAYEDGDEDDNCDEDSSDIKIERNKHDVIIKSVKITPSSAKCGEDVVISVNVLNTGRSDEDDVYIKLLNNFLKLDEKSDLFDLDKYDDQDDSETKTFYFNVPDNADAKDYSIEAVVYYDDEDETDSEFITLTITSCGEEEASTTTTTGEVSITVSDSVISAKEGSSFSIPVKVTNLGTKIVSYEVEVVNIGDWAELTSSKTVTLGSGQSTTTYLYLNAKDNITAGKRSATVNVKSGTEILATQTVTVDISKRAAGEEGIVASTTAALTGLSSKVFWIIGDIILIVIAIFFVKLIFTGGKKKQTGVEEIKI